MSTERKIVAKNLVKEKDTIKVKRSGENSEQF